MRRTIFAVALFAGCGSDSGEGEPTCPGCNFDCYVNDAPCCEAPPLPCEEPMRADGPGAYILTCEATTGPFEGHAHDDELSVWGADQININAAHECWVGIGHVARITTISGAKACFDREGRSADCADVETDWATHRNAYYAAHPRQD